MLMLLLRVLLLLLLLTKTPSATSDWEIISTDRKVFLCPPELLKAA